MLLEQELKFTKVCRDNWGLPIPLREARALRALYPALLPPIEEEDLFAGRTLKMEWSGVGFSPDVTLYSLPHGMGFFYRRDVFEQALSQASENQKPAIRDAMAFWEKENTTAHVKAAFSDRIRKALPSDSFAGDVGVGFPLYRMTGAYENYELLLSLGLDGLLARINAAEKKNPQAEEGFYAALGQPQLRDAEPVCPVTLYQCLPKGEKTDEIVRRAVELGATRIVAVISERCVARPDGKAFSKRLERLNRISESAAAQCGRAVIPPVCGLISYREAAKEIAACGLGFICYEGEGTRPLRELAEHKAPESIGFLIGPEGGLSDAETALAAEHGIPLAGLGKRIMRTETASAYVLAALDILL